MIVINAIGAGLFIGIGILCLWKTAWLREKAVEAYRQYPAAIRIKAIERHLESAAYIWTTRIVGFVSIVAGVGVLVLLFGTAS